MYPSFLIPTSYFLFCPTPSFLKECPPHQDWLTTESIVIALSLNMDGMRIMVQFVLRIKGKGQAKLAIQAIRKHLLGAKIVGVVISKA